MATFPQPENMAWNTAPLLTGELVHEGPIWEKISSWMVLLPTLFITVSGNIQTQSGPVAFRFTAMEDDSTGRKLARIVCLILMLLLMSTHTRQILAACNRSRLLFFLPALAFASVLWSQNPRHTLVDATTLLLTMLFAVYLCVRYPGDQLVSFLTFAAFISLALCAFVVVAFPSIGIDAFQQDSWRGIFGQRNNCAASCTLFLVIGLHAKSKGIMEQLMNVAVILLSLVFIVMSGSRTGFIVAALAVSLTFGLRFVARVRSLDRILFFMLIAVPIAVAAYLIASNFNAVLAAMDKDPTLTQRTIIWAEVVPSILKHPFLGYGYSAFWVGLNGESSQTVLVTGWMEGQAQDGYLDVLLQLGIAGLIPVVIVFIRGFVQATLTVERRLLTPAKAFAAVVLPLVLIENIGETSILLPLGVPWLYALVSLVVLALPAQAAEES